MLTWGRVRRRRSEGALHTWQYRIGRRAQLTRYCRPLFTAAAEVGPMSVPSPLARHEHRAVTCSRRNIDLGLLRLTCSPVSIVRAFIDNRFEASRTYSQCSRRLRVLLLSLLCAPNILCAVISQYTSSLFLPQLKHLRPKQYKNLKKREKTVSRAYGGSLCADCVRQR